MLLDCNVNTININNVSKQNANKTYQLINLVLFFATKIKEGKIK